MLAVCAVLRETPLSTVEPAVEAEPPVPAARGLQEVAPDRPHRAQLGRRGLRARLPQGLRDLRVDLELRQRRSRADRRPVDAARNGVRDVDERVRRDEVVAKQRHEVGAAGQCDRAVAERGRRLAGARRPQELHGAPSRGQPRVPAAFPRG